MQLPVDGITFIQIIILIGQLILFILTLWRSQKTKLNIAQRIDDYKQTVVEQRLFESLIEVHRHLRKGLIMAKQLAKMEGRKNMFELQAIGTILMDMSWSCGSLSTIINSIGSRMSSFKLCPKARRTKYNESLVRDIQTILGDISKWLKSVMDEGLDRFDHSKPIYQRRRKLDDSPFFFRG
jgi:hypothetical protein